MKILIFSPFAGIWKHEELQLNLANSLVAKGHDITVLRCNRDISNFCNTMSAFGLNYDSSKDEKMNICNKCTASRDFISSFNRINFEMLDERFYEIKKHLSAQIDSQVDISNWMNFKIENIAIGKIAAYEFFIRHKLSSYQIPIELFPEYRDSLLSTASLFFFAKLYFESSSFDRVIVYNRLYSLNNVLCKVAEELKIPTYSLQASGGLGNIYGRASLYSEDNQIFGLPKSVSWRKFLSISTSKSQTKIVSDHFNGLFAAKSPWVYSTKYDKKAIKNLREFFEIKSDAKITLLAMSSVDELFAAQVIGLKDFTDTGLSEKIFKDQLEWVKFVVNSYENHDGFHLIIRIHPRMFPNKREGVTSPAAQIYRKYLDQIDIRNVSINYPEDGISIYSIASIADRLTVWNSSVGAEFAALDIPVISFDVESLTAFPPETSFSAKNLSNYSELLVKDFSIDQVQMKSYFAFKWFIFKYEMNSEAYTSHMFKPVHFAFQLIRRVALKYDLEFMKPIASKIFNRDFGKANLLPLSTRVIEDSLETVSMSRAFGFNNELLHSDVDVISQAKLKLKRKLFS